MAKPNAQHNHTTNYFTRKCKVATMNVSYPSIPKDKQEGMVILTGKCSTVKSCIMNIIKFLFRLLINKKNQFFI